MTRLQDDRKMDVPALRHIIEIVVRVHGHFRAASVSRIRVEEVSIGGGRRRHAGSLPGLNC
jgi:hypothetical protein